MSSFPKPKVNLKTKQNIKESKRVFKSDSYNKFTEDKKSWALIYLNEGWMDYYSDYSITHNPYISGERSELWTDGWISARNYFST